MVPSLDPSNTAPSNFMAAIGQAGLGTYLIYVISTYALAPKFIPTQHAAFDDVYMVLKELSIILVAKGLSPNEIPETYPFSLNK